MRLLLDTHVALWFLQDSPRLGARMRDIVIDSANEVVVSSVSVAEVAIKTSTGKLRGTERFVSLCRDAGVAELALTSAHADGLRDLPFLHRDPFDRLLICQARSETLTLATVDPQCTQYDVTTVDGGH